MILKYIEYNSSNVDNQLYLDDDLICNDLRKCKMFMKWLQLKLVKVETVHSSFFGEYKIYYYEK
mgnify:CR=1 FL=1